MSFNLKKLSFELQSCFYAFLNLRYICENIENKH